MNLDFTSFLASKEVKPKVSLDRVTFLVYSPRLSLWSNSGNERYVYQMKFLVESRLQDVLDWSYRGQSTALFKHHYRTFDGVDIQFGCFMPLRHKVTDFELRDFFGKDSNFDYTSNPYAFRVEYNPNESNLSSVKPLLQFFATSGILLDDIRISRLDIAWDYPCEVNPSLVICDRMRKSFLAIGKSGIETVYFGSRSSQFFIRIYNKAVELREQQKKDFTGSLWRFELEMKDSFLASDTPDLGEVLRRFHFYRSGVRSGDWVLDLLLSHAKDYGLKSALSGIPRSTRDRYKRLLDQCMKSEQIEHPFFSYKREFFSLMQNLRTEIALALGLNIDFSTC